MIAKREFKEFTPEKIEEVEKIGYCTAWEIFQQYGITKQVTSYAIRKNKLTAFMKSEGEMIIIKWYIVKDHKYEEFIEAKRKK